MDFRTEYPPLCFQLTSCIPIVLHPRLPVKLTTRSRTHLGPLLSCFTLPDWTRLFQPLNRTNDLHCRTTATGPVLDEVPHRNLTLVESQISGTYDRLFLILSMRALFSGWDKSYHLTFKNCVPVQREEDDDDGGDGVLFPWEDEQGFIADLSHDGWVLTRIYPGFPVLIWFGMA